jgi:pimeloyl-ACP methyl ester carboxylesterase
MLRVTTSDGTTISVEECGAGPSFLLVHGTSQTRAAWSRVVPFLQADYRVFTMDRRGRGESTDGPTYSLAQEADDVARVAEKLPSPVHLVGHSSGALCVLEALRLTSAIASVTLYEPPIATEGFPMPSATSLRAAAASGSSEGLLDTFMRDYVGLPPAALEASRRDPSWPARVALAPTICREVEAVLDYALDRRRFAGIATPVLVLLGERSPPWMAAGTRAVADSLPCGELATLMGQGHIAMLTAPELLAVSISAYAGAQRRPDTGGATL